MNTQAAIEKRPRPEGWAEEYARTFTDPSVATAYHTRPEYPPESFARLKSFVKNGRAGKALDLGCGTGFLARNLAFADQVDAVDFSAPMLAVAKNLPAQTKVNWIFGKAEEVPLNGPYDLVTAAESLHWMDWDALFPHLKPHLSPGAPFVILDHKIELNPWNQECQPVITRFSTNKKYKAVDLIAELLSRGLYHREEEYFTDLATYSQSIADYIESYHARNGLSRERMTMEAAAEFDRLMAEILRRYARDGMLTLRLRTQLVKGVVL